LKKEHKTGEKEERKSPDQHTTSNQKKGVENPAKGGQTFQGTYKEIRGKGQIFQEGGFVEGFVLNEKREDQNTKNKGGMEQDQRN